MINSLLASLSGLFFLLAQELCFKIIRIHLYRKENIVNQHIGFVKELVSQGGPDPGDYDVFSNWIGRVSHELQSGVLNPNNLKIIRDAFGTALSMMTIQGYAYQKPHGYAGDYEVIDRMYQYWISPIEELKNWDHYAHAQGAVQAVRNRKKYFIQLLKLYEERFKNRQLNVLDIGSGSSRDIFEFFSKFSQGNTYFDCVEYDKKAISYSKNLCQKYIDNIKFYQKNALRFSTNKRYQLIWSAGLFDYFSDQLFQFLLKRLYEMLDTCGELVIGNFNTDNPTQCYMEIMADWKLNYRSKKHLIDLALVCGIDKTNIHIGQEPEGIKLFLHLKKKKHFILR